MGLTGSFVEENKAGFIPFSQNYIMIVGYIQQFRAKVRFIGFMSVTK